MNSGKTYRSTMIIIQSILEELVKHHPNGIIKYKLFKDLPLRTSIGKQYPTRLEEEGYLTVEQENMDKKIRYSIVYFLSKRGEGNHLTHFYQTFFHYGFLILYIIIEISQYFI